ncbi:MAG TPA: ABC transporter substrate-binding protein [Thermoflexales bacterium]|nr:ABC transporter substrate-binding protein [Thermoflexales bacterium]
MRNLPSARSAKPGALFLILALLLAACARPQVEVKIALVAPFEGRYRAIGYEAFPAFRIALRERAAQPGTRITFVAYTDDGDPEKAEQIARAVALDPQVILVMGHFLPDTTARALPVYTQAGLPVLVMGTPPAQFSSNPLVFVPPSAITQTRLPAPAAFANYASVSGGAGPGAGSVGAYHATRLALRAIDAAAQPTRAEVASQLHRVDYAP